MEILHFQYAQSPARSPSHFIPELLVSYSSYIFFFFSFPLLGQLPSCLHVSVLSTELSLEVVNELIADGKRFFFFLACQVSMDTSVF